MKYILSIIISLSIFLSGCALSWPAHLNNSSENKTGNAPLDNQNQNKTLQTDERLDLSKQGLSQIPKYVFNMQNLEELNVSNNQLTGAIQAEIRHLQNLKILNASNNKMTGVPAEIGQLSNLQILDLSNNQLTGLPYELGNLKNLKTLNISGNTYSEVDLGIITESLPKDVNIIK